MTIQTGYGDRPSKSIPPPEDVEWKVQITQIGEGEAEKDKVFVRVEIDGDSLGLLRLPNTAYLLWLRERIQEKGKE